jgi:hypothetical protein
MDAKSPPEGEVPTTGGLADARVETADARIETAVCSRQMGVGLRLSSASLSDLGEKIGTGDGIAGQDQSRPLRSLGLVLLLGVGAHSSKQSLGPLEPSLSAMGVGPIGFAVLTITPGVAAMVMPLAWGAAWTLHARFVLRGSPLLQLCAQALLVCGVLLHNTTNTVPILTASVLVCGLILFSIGRAGLAIAQHATLARLYKSQLVLVFAAMTGCTQVIAAVVNLMVPRIVKAVEGHDSAGGAAKPHLRASAGLLTVQLVLLIPHSLASVAGALLARSRPAIAAAASDDTLAEPSVEPSQASSHWFRDSRLGEESSPSLKHTCSDSPANSPVNIPAAPSPEAQPPGQHTSPVPLPPPLRPLLNLSGLSHAPSAISTRPPVRLWASAVVALSVWRGLAIGSLHALKPVLIAMLVSVGASTVDAGGVIAINYALALIAYLLLAFMSSVGKLRWCLVALPALGLLAFVTMLFEVQRHGAGDPGSGAVPNTIPPLVPAAAGAAADQNSSSLAHATHAGRVHAAINPFFRAALLGVALVAAASPVVPLALVPANTGDHGLGYGVLESIFEGSEIILSLLIGVCRSAGGFSATLILLIGAFAGALLVGARLVTRLREQVLDRSWVPAWFQKRCSPAQRVAESPVDPISPSYSANERVTRAVLLTGLRDVGNGGHTLVDHSPSRKGADDYHRMVG